MPSILHKGCELAYDIEGTGPAVVFIQGVGLHGAGWTPQTNVLRKDFTCLRFDNRGMARSQPIGDAFTIEQMADDTLAIMDAAGFQSAHLVGHSMGGLIALQCALNSRQRVRSLMLMNTFADGSVPTTLSTWLIWVGLQTVVGPRAWRRGAFLRMILPPRAFKESDTTQLADELAPIFGHDLADQPPIARQQLKAMRGCNLLNRLHELDGLPTKVLIGHHDRIAPPPAGHAIVAGIPGATFEEYADAAHGLPLQHADRVNRVLIEHLQRSELRYCNS